MWASAEDEGALNRQRTAFGRNGYGIGELETGMALPLNRWTPEGRPQEGLRIVQVGRPPNCPPTRMSSPPTGTRRMRM